MRCLILLALVGCSLDASGKNRCERATDCLAGFVCQLATQTCVPETECERATSCGSAQCGAPDDGCGGTLECGNCAAPNVCGATYQCEPPPAHCTNEQPDGDETDVDCGGSCAPCAYGKACGNN